MKLSCVYNPVCLQIVCLQIVCLQIVYTQMQSIPNAFHIQSGVCLTNNQVPRGPP